MIFSTEDALAPGAVEGHGKTFGPITYPVPTENNIYEWYRGQVSLLATGEVEAIDMGGPDGRDVFIKTYQQLAPQDTDFTSDLYDLRTGGGFPAPASAAEPCNPEVSCQSEALVAPAGSTPASSVFSGPGNDLLASLPAVKPRTTASKPLDRAQKLAKALKACRSKSKRKQAACIKQAEKRYGKSKPRKVQGKAKQPSRGGK